jgi:hypothetical protein
MFAPPSLYGLGSSTEAALTASASSPARPMTSAFGRPRASVWQTVEPNAISDGGTPVVSAADARVRRLAPITASQRP